MFATCIKLHREGGTKKKQRKRGQQDPHCAKNGISARWRYDVTNCPLCVCVFVYALVFQSRPASTHHTNITSCINYTFTWAQMGVYVTHYNGVSSLVASSDVANTHYTQERSPFPRLCL